MSLTRNTIANYIGQGYSIAVGIIVLPLYLGYLGAEAYGLVGLFTLLKSWMSLLDLGMSPTLGREVSRLKNHPTESSRLNIIVTTLERIFVMIALVIMLTLISSSDWVAKQWLNVEQLPIDIVIQSLTIMSVVVAVRWQATLYKSAINGYEAQVWLNGFEVIINTLRYPLILIIISYNPGHIELFFWCQLFVSLIELTGVRYKVSRLLPQEGMKGHFSLQEIRTLLPFCISIAYTGAVWIFLTQYDKLILSNILTLENYGYFALMVTVTNGVVMLSSPISRAVLPRLTSLLAQDRKVEMVKLYRKSTRYVVISVAPIILIIVLWPQQVIYAWSGDQEAARWIAPYLSIFTLGSALVTIGKFQHFLQYAYGEMKYHVRYNTFSLIINVPLITIAAYQFGVIGVAWAWFGFRFFTFLFWVPFIHHVFLPGLHMKWLIEDVLKVLFVPVFIYIVIKGLSYQYDLGDFKRFEILFMLFGALGFGYVVELIKHKYSKYSL